MPKKEEWPSAEDIMVSALVVLLGFSLATEEGALKARRYARALIRFLDNMDYEIRRKG